MPTMNEPVAADVDDDEHPDAPQAPAVAASPLAQVSPPPPAAAPATAPSEQGIGHKHLPQVHPETVLAATWEGLINKQARRTTVKVPSVDGNGDEVILEMKMVAISNPAYDALLDKYAPSRDDQAKGAIWDRKKFPPALLEAVVTSPKLTYEQWMELSTSDNWSGGEFGDLFAYANRICQGGLDVPFTGRG